MEFIQFVKNFELLSDTQLESLADTLVYKSHNSGDIVIQADSVCHSISFLEKGKAIASFINHAGQEFVWNFYFSDEDSKFENYFPFDYQSFLNQQPTNLVFKILEPSTIAYLSFEKTTKLFQADKAFENLGRVMSENAFRSVYNRSFDILTKNATDLYLKLLDDEPYLLNKFTHFQVAAYLGIAPQSFSRIRKNILDTRRS